MPIFGGSEGVVYGVVAAGFLVELEHGEIHHPQRCPAVLQQALFFAEVTVTDFQAQAADSVIHHFGLVSAKEQQITVLCAAARQNFGNGFVVQIFHNRGLQTFTTLSHFIDLDPRQTFGTVNFHKLGETVDLAAAHLATTWHSQSNHSPTFGSCRAAEDFEIHIRHDIGEFGELKLDPQIGLVRAKAVHGF